MNVFITRLLYYYYYGIITGLLGVIIATKKIKKFKKNKIKIQQNKKNKKKRVWVGSGGTFTV